MYYCHCILRIVFESHPSATERKNVTERRKKVWNIAAYTFIIKTKIQNWSIILELILGVLGHNEGGGDRMRLTMKDIGSFYCIML
jgi:hypothetical protein